MIITLAALVITGLGGFLIYRYGESERVKGFLQCQEIGAALATEAGEQLKNEVKKFYTPSAVDRKLLDADWLRQPDDL
jgi:hypothetical protein